MQYQNDKLQITNLWLIRMNAERILDTFSAADNIERIYINFAILGLEESTKEKTNSY